jgi:peptidoglycan hydrolase-like protein with peptidoglycan-binding domain
MRNTDNNVAIQERLIELGYNPGKVDGIIGKNTIAALREAAKSGHILHNGKLISPNAESY